MRSVLLSLCIFLTVAGASASNGADYASFIDSLRAERISIKPEGRVDQPFFSAKGRVISVYGEHLQIFQYPDRAKADMEAARVSSDGRTVGTTKPHWLARPHFFKKDKLIVLYVGDDEKVLKALEARLGRQFAGE